MTYKITLSYSGVPTEVVAPASSASVETHTEGLDSLRVSVTWKLNDLQDDPNYETIRYTWPSPTTRLQLRREDNDVMVFDGQVHGLEADRDANTFTVHAES